MREIKETRRMINEDFQSKIIQNANIIAVNEDLMILLENYKVKYPSEYPHFVELLKETHEISNQTIELETVRLEKRMKKAALKEVKGNLVEVARKVAKFEREIQNVKDYMIEVLDLEKEKELGSIIEEMNSMIDEASNQVFDELRDLWRSSLQVEVLNEQGLCEVQNDEEEEDVLLKRYQKICAEEIEFLILANCEEEKVQHLLDKSSDQDEGNAEERLVKLRSQKEMRLAEFAHAKQQIFARIRIDSAKVFQYFRRIRDGVKPGCDRKKLESLFNLFYQKISSAEADFYRHLGKLRRKMKELNVTKASNDALAEKVDVATREVQNLKDIRTDLQIKLDEAIKRKAEQVHQLIDLAEGQARMILESQHSFSSEEAKQQMLNALLEENKTHLNKVFNEIKQIWETLEGNDRHRERNNIFVVKELENGFHLLTDELCELSAKNQLFQGRLKSELDQEAKLSLALREGILSLRDRSKSYIVKEHQTRYARLLEALTSNDVVNFATKRAFFLDIDGQQSHRYQKVEVQSRVSLIQYELTHVLEKELETLKGSEKTLAQLRADIIAKKKYYNELSLSVNEIKQKLALALDDESSESMEQLDAENLEDLCHTRAKEVYLGRYQDILDAQMRLLKEKSPNGIDRSTGKGAQSHPKFGRIVIDIFQQDRAVTPQREVTPGYPCNSTHIDDVPVSQGPPVISKTRSHSLSLCSLPVKEGVTSAKSLTKPTGRTEHSQMNTSDQGFLRRELQTNSNEASAIDIDTIPNEQNTETARNEAPTEAIAIGQDEANHNYLQTFNTIEYNNNIISSPTFQNENVANSSLERLREGITVYKKFAIDKGTIVTKNNVFNPQATDPKCLNPELCGYGKRFLKFNDAKRDLEFYKINATGSGNMPSGRRNIVLECRYAVGLIERLFMPLVTQSILRAREEAKYRVGDSGDRQLQVEMLPFSVDVVKVGRIDCVSLSVEEMIILYSAFQVILTSLA
eukprot:TRINITY_DN3758_c0_g2_i4.p1 TRINITY_DN3758_c0_g2~~TRINITY_DN3758_c0_g2_i4.p1  ORF type:complete len:976 (-),score=229.55 TRINITY_DN3758_c0_g2_i4:91-3018(-)